MRCHVQEFQSLTFITVIKIISQLFWYISTANEEFYFRDMGELKLKTENTVTARIPIRNNDLELLVYTINSYYKTKSACTDKIVGLYDRVSD